MLYVPRLGRIAPAVAGPRAERLAVRVQVAGKADESGQPVLVVGPHGARRHGDASGVRDDADAEVRDVLAQADAEDLFRPGCRKRAHATG